MPSSYELKRAVEVLLADETGTIYRDAPFRISLVYPSPYRVGMSSLGFQTIYRLLNDLPEICCERSFLPDDVAAHHQSRTPLFTFESESPVGNADVVALSVAYETEILGVLQCLDLSGIPRRFKDRDNSHPLVLMGGPLTFSNPLPLGPFADVIVMGEAEDLLPVLIQWYRDTPGRHDFLRDVALLPGVYVPSIHGETLIPVAQCEDSKLPAFSQILTPHTELSGMHLVENARGCHRGCTFCVMRRTTNAGMRAVEADRVLQTIPDAARRVGLVGAATSDHPQIRDILRSTVDGGREVGLSSLRADRLDDEFVGLLSRGGARTLTIASDGSSERMRRIAQKGIKVKHLRRCAELVRHHDLRLLKLYMVIGYPQETMDDIEEMIELLRELSSICTVALGMSPLVAKKNTPLDGVPFQDEKFLQTKIKRVHKALGSSVDIRSTSVRWAWIEYQLSQGGWDMADAAEAALEWGGNFAAWKRAIKTHQKDYVALQKPLNDRLRPGARLGDFTHPSEAPSHSIPRPTDSQAPPSPEAFFTL